MVEIGCGLEPLFCYYDNYSQFICVEPAGKFFKQAVAQKQGRQNVVLINDFFENAVSQITMHVDCIVCSSLLHEVENPYDFLMHIRKIADENTMIHINVPNAKSFHRLLAISSGMINDVHDISANNIMLQQHAVFDLVSLKELIEGVGNVEILEQGSFFVKPFTHAQMKKCLDGGIIDRRILDGLYHVTEYVPELGSEIFIDFKWK